MDVITAIKSRRAIKHFDPNHRLSEHDIDTLLSLARLSPTAFNIQHWRFVLVQDPALRAAIRAVAWMQPQVTEASLRIVICADIKAWETKPEHYWRNAPPKMREGLLAAIDSLPRPQDRATRQGHALLQNRRSNPHARGPGPEL